MTQLKIEQTWETTATLDVNAGTNFNINGSMATLKVKLTHLIAYIQSNFHTDINGSMATLTVK